MGEPSALCRTFADRAATSGVAKCACRRARRLGRLADEVRRLIRGGGVGLMGKAQIGRAGLLAIVTGHPRSPGRTRRGSIERDGAVGVLTACTTARANVDRARCRGTSSPRFQIPASAPRFRWTRPSRSLPGSHGSKARGSSTSKAGRRPFARSWIRPSRSTPTLRRSGVHRCDATASDRRSRTWTTCRARGGARANLAQVSMPSPPPLRDNKLRPRG